MLLYMSKRMYNILADSDAKIPLNPEHTSSITFNTTSLFPYLIINWELFKDRGTSFFISIDPRVAIMPDKEHVMFLMNKHINKGISIMHEFSRFK